MTIPTPRFLYHGAHGEQHSHVMFNGLLPRIHTGINNWPNKSSREDMVYLTDTYAPFYAQQSFDQQPTRGCNLVIYEIDTHALDPLSLCADEDVLQQWARQSALETAKHMLLSHPMMEFVMGTQLDKMRQISAARSLDALGTCAHHGPIPIHAITRAVFYSPRVSKLMQVALNVVAVNTEHFELHGEAYQQAMRWLFRFDQENAGPLTGVTFEPEGHRGSIDDFVHWPDFNFWTNERYIGDAKFDLVRHHGNSTLIPVQA